MRRWAQDARDSADTNVALLIPDGIQLLAPPKHMATLLDQLKVHNIPNDNIRVDVNGDMAVILNDFADAKHPSINGALLCAQHVMALFPNLLAIPAETPQKLSARFSADTVGKELTEALRPAARQTEVTSVIALV